jgi:hypothetical protein
MEISEEFRHAVKADMEVALKDLIKDVCETAERGFRVKSSTIATEGCLRQFLNRCYRLYFRLIHGD